MSINCTHFHPKCACANFFLSWALLWLVPILQFSTNKRILQILKNSKNCGERAFLFLCSEKNTLSYSRNGESHSGEILASRRSAYRGLVSNWKKARDQFKNAIEELPVWFLIPFSLFPCIVFVFCGSILRHFLQKLFPGEWSYIFSWHGLKTVAIYIHSRATVYQRAFSEANFLYFSSVAWNNCCIQLMQVLFITFFCLRLLRVFPNTRNCMCL